MLFYACEIGLTVHISGLDAGGRGVDDVLKTVAILEEFCVADLPFIIAIDKSNLGNLLGCQRKPEVG